MRESFSPGGKRCVTCQQPLTTYWEICEGVCSRLACRGPHLQWQRAERERRERADRDALAESARVILRTRLTGALPPCAEAVLIVVPHFASRLAPPTGERISRFKSNLAQALDQAVQQISQEGRAAAIQREYAHRHEERLPLPVVNACTTCRGACCRQGGDHAFLVASFLAWRLMNERAASPAALIDDYLSRRPDESFADSCLFHTPAGCALPRAIRGPMCNEFLCTGIVDHHHELAIDPERSSLVVAFDNGQFLRAGWLDRHAAREEFDLTTE